MLIRIQQLYQSHGSIERIKNGWKNGYGKHIKISKISCVYRNRFFNRFLFFQWNLALIPLLDSNEHAQHKIKIF